MFAIHSYEVMCYQTSQPQHLSITTKYCNVEIVFMACTMPPRVLDELSTAHCLAFLVKK